MTRNYDQVSIKPAAGSKELRDKIDVLGQTLNYIDTAEFDPYFTEWEDWTRPLLPLGRQ